jgi:Integrase
MRDFFYFINTQVQPTSLARELIAFAMKYNSVPLSRRRTKTVISNASQNHHIQRITALIRAIQRSETPLLHLSEIALVHVAVMVNYVSTRCNKSGSFDNWICSLNRLLTWVKKKKLLVSSREIRTLYGLASRSGFCDRNKATSDLSKIDQAIAEMEAAEPQVAAVLKICKVWPLRVREAICLNLSTAIEQTTKNNQIHLTSGVKNGRPRFVHSWRKDQLDALVEVVPLANTLYGTLVPEGMTLKAFLNHFHRTVRAHDLTIRNGLNPHSLRHQLLQDYYFYKTGLQAPIIGHNPAIKQTDLVARLGFQSVTELAGHSRIGKASAYLGSIRAYRKSPMIGITK